MEKINMYKKIKQRIINYYRSRTDRKYIYYNSLFFYSHNDYVFCTKHIKISLSDIRYFYILSAPYAQHTYYMITNKNEYEISPLYHIHSYWYDNLWIYKYDVYVNMNLLYLTKCFKYINNEFIQIKNIENKYIQDKIDAYRLVEKI